MPEIKLTEKNVESLRCPQGKEREEYADVLMPGLRLRVTASGSRSWSVVYRIKGRERDGQKRRTLGPLDRISLAEARETARATLNAAHQGHDPAAMPETEKTFAELFAAYLERYAKVNVSSWREYQRMAKKDLLPRWGKQVAASLRRRDVLEVLEVVTGRSAPKSANRLLQLISGIYTWAIKNDLAEVNPAFGIDQPNPQSPRSRVLTPGEIAELLTFMEAEYAGEGRIDHDPRHGLALLLRLFTGQRTEEVIRLRQQDLDGEEWWGMPGEITKNGRPCRVYLIPLARERVLDRLAPDGKGHLFGSHRRIGQPISRTTVTAYVLALQEELKTDWTARDLRRTVVTNLARLRVTKDIRKRIVNHSDGRDVHDEHYDWYDYDDQKKEAMLRWEGHLRTLLEGSGARILPLRR